MCCAVLLMCTVVLSSCPHPCPSLLVCPPRTVLAPPTSPTECNPRLSPSPAPARKPTSQCWHCPSTSPFSQAIGLTFRAVRPPARMRPTTGRTWAAPLVSTAYNGGELRAPPLLLKLPSRMLCAMWGCANCAPLHPASSATGWSVTPAHAPAASPRPCLQGQKLL